MRPISSASWTLPSPRRAAARRTRRSRARRRRSPASRCAARSRRRARDGLAVAGREREEQLRVGRARSCVASSPTRPRSKSTIAAARLEAHVAGVQVGVHEAVREDHAAHAAHAGRHDAAHVDVAARSRSSSRRPSTNSMRQHLVRAGVRRTIAREVERRARRRSCARKRRLWSASFAQVDLLLDGVAEGRDGFLERRRAAATAPAVRRSARRPAGSSGRARPSRATSGRRTFTATIAPSRAASRGAPARPTRPRPAALERREELVERPRRGSPRRRAARRRTGRAAPGRAAARARRPARGGSRSARVEAIWPTLMKVAPRRSQSATWARPRRARRPRRPSRRSRHVSRNSTAERRRRCPADELGEAGLRHCRRGARAGDRSRRAA